MHASTRRQFLGRIGHGMLAGAFGAPFAQELFGAPAAARLAPPPARPREELEALIRRMQRTAPDELQPQLVTAVRAGTPLRTLVTAAALANARTFGGHDYEGYHAFMALLPALALSERMPAGLEPLPVLKVVWRSTARIRKAGRGREDLEVVEAVEAAAPGARTGDALRERVRAADQPAAEQEFARRFAEGTAAAAWDGLQPVVEDDVDVHRVVLAWRAWDLAKLAGEAHAHALLRQIVRYCAKEEQERIARGHPVPAIRAEVPPILERHRLLGGPLGRREADDAWIARLADTIWSAERAKAAEAAAAALAEGFDPEAVAEAIALAANELLLRDPGKKRVHGASVGVHASDAANAWRNVAASTDRHRAASLVVAAYHTAGQSGQVGAERWSFAERLDALRDTTDRDALLRAAAAAIEDRDQQGACAAIHRYGEGGHPAEPAFDLLLRYAVSEDGALHAEKYFHTVEQEFARTRTALRWRWLTALARVTASEFGEPAPGVAAARASLSA